MTEQRHDQHLDSDSDKPENPSRRRLLESIAIAGAALAVGGEAIAAGAGRAGAASAAKAKVVLDEALRRRIGHVIVIYCENRSFNNLFANFPGLAQPLASLPPERFVQRDRDGSVLAKLPPIWSGLVPHKQVIDGQTYRIKKDAIIDLANAPWALRTPDGEPLPQRVVTSNPVHRFYENQMQIDGGKNDAFVAWGNNGALQMGYYDNSASSLRLWKLAREYTLLDNFFMGAFGGSFLAHQYLIAAQPGFYPDADHSPARDLIAVLADGPDGHRLKLVKNSPASAMQGKPKFASEGQLTPDFHAVNTFGPPYWPSFNRSGKNPTIADWSKPDILPPQTHRTIGDALSEKGIDWAWYAGGWQLALEGNGKHGIRDTFPVSPNFQAHHQPFNYFRQFAPGTTARKQHLRDGGHGNDASTNRFIADIEASRLPAVSFYKPQGNLNMHAGYSDIAAGDAHVTHIIDVLKASALWKDTVVIITVDENGGWWDHVAPPRADRWGPGTRIPALVVSAYAKRGHVEHAVHDTGSIQRFLNRRFGLEPLPGIVLRDRSMREHNGFAPGDLTQALDLA